MSPDPQVRDPLADELEAIAAIGHALANVHDPVARVRILRWAVDRFLPQQIAATGLTAPLAPAAPRAESDPAAGVPPIDKADDLDDLFEHEPASRKALRDAAPAGEPAPVQPPPQPVESLVRGFVTDFQRLVVEWQGA